PSPLLANKNPNQKPTRKNTRTRPHTHQPNRHENPKKISLSLKSKKPN
ncbi:hypothetical protein HMPREF3189_01424, partial [Clostridiales bacterium KA00134]